MAATLRELARRAGVSVSTVSRAISRPALVESSTRERILGLAAELHYAPNPAARALSTGRTGIWGLVVPDLRNPFFPGLVKGAQRAAQECDRSLLIVDTDEDPLVEFALVQGLAQRSDAIVLCSSRMTDDEVEQASALCPVVLVNRDHPSVPTVTFDTRQGVREAAEHLRALRHRSIGYVAGPVHSFSDRDRADSVREEFAKQGMDVVHLGHFEPSSDGGRAAADRVLLAGVTAVMCYDDIMAMGLIARLQSYGVRVPEQVSVIGWDDIEFASLFTPALTTIHLPRVEAGESAVALLNSLADGRAEPSARLGSRLIFRQTTTTADAAS